MTIGMQGSWTVSVESKSAAWPQRFRIQGSTNGVDGVHPGTPGTSVFVTGSQWGITVEHDPAGPASWTPSRQRMRGFGTSGGQFRFFIDTNDSAPGDDFNDLVLRCSMPLSESQWVIYGNVKSYSGFCRVNPCFPKQYYVIESAAQLAAAIAFAPARRILETLYPARVKAVVRRPFPEPDPEPFVPMMIPTGLWASAGLAVEGKTVLADPVQQTRRGAKPVVASAIEPLQTAMLRDVAQGSATAGLAQSDLIAVGKYQYRPYGCVVSPVPETLLRVVEYDRTDAELLGDPYTGAGNREVLGLTSTDELGNYLFRFSRSVGQLVAESEDRASGESAATQAMPDVILQIMAGLPEAVAYETAPYYNIANIRRIDLCVPKSAIGNPPNACQGGRVIQKLGDIFVVPNPGSTLHADGTVSNQPPSTAGPMVRHAAWISSVELYGCFLDTTPKVRYYTVEYRKDGTADWHFVNEQYDHLKKQLDGSWANTKVGPFDQALFIGSPGDPVTVGAYDNHEEDSEWLNADRDRKIRLNTAIYQPGFGAVHFRIRGYDASGQPVPGAVDTVKLLIDNKLSVGDIDSVRLLGTADPGECALLGLPTASEPLTVRFRAVDAEGFLDSYAINVYRGSNHHVATVKQGTSDSVAGAYQDVVPFRYFGTPDESGADADGYVEVNVVPSGETWLGPHSFCAFSFELTLSDRLTTGKTAGPSGRLVWRELIGMSAPAPS